MKKGKNSDSKPNRVCVRMSDTHFEFVNQMADALGVTSSDYVRMLIDKQISLVARKESKECQLVNQ